MNAQTLSVILSSAAFKANPELFLKAMAIGTEAEAPVAEAPVAEAEAPVAQAELPVAEAEAPKLKKQWSPEVKAKAAAKRAAMEQMRPGDDVGITWEDAGGKWHQEVSDGEDRPVTSVEG
jgi:hypothetical protein